MPRLSFKVAMIPALIAGLGGCAEGSRQPGAPLPQITVITLSHVDLPNIMELPSRIAGIQIAEVRARVNGLGQRRLFEEGTDEQKGAPLFQIDPREYRAQVEQGHASLQRAIAARTNAASVVARCQPIVTERSVSGQENDAAVSQLRQAEAQIAQVADARAALAQQQLRLSARTDRRTRQPRGNNRRGSCQRRRGDAYEAR